MTTSATGEAARATTGAVESAGKTATTGATTTSGYIRPRPLDDPALRVIGFHHAGGSAAGSVRSSG